MATKAKRKTRKSVKSTTISVARSGKGTGTVRIPQADLGAVLQCLAKTGQMKLTVREVGRSKAGSPKMVINVED